MLYSVPRILSTDLYDSVCTRHASVHSVSANHIWTQKKIIAYLKEMEEQAHFNHVNLWAYGDPREDEENMKEI